MLLNHFTLAHYLANHLKPTIRLSYEDIIEKKFSIEHRTARNIVFWVSKEDGNSFFIKQPTLFDYTTKQAWLREKFVLTKKRWANNDFAKHLPDLLDNDYKNQILITKSLDDQQTLLEWVNSKPQDFFVNLSARLKDLQSFLKILHSSELIKKVEHEMPRSMRTNTRPWLIAKLYNLYYEEEELPTSYPERTFWELLKDSQEVKELYHRVNKWGKVLIHGDLRLENILCYKSLDKTAVSIIDWENSRLGDPKFDIATLFVDLLDRLKSNNILNEEEVNKLKKPFLDVYEPTDSVPNIEDYIKILGLTNLIHSMRLSANKDDIEKDVKRILTP